MTSFDHHNLDPSAIADAVRAGVALAREEWEHDLSEAQKIAVDERIDRKIDKVKVWLFGGVIATIAANFIPLAIMAYQFGSFTGEIRSQIGSFKEAGSETYTRTQHEAYAREVDRRFIELERRAQIVENQVFEK